MKVINLFPGSFASNCYLLIDNGHAAIVDPSASTTAILSRLDAFECTLDTILLTHGHFDHLMSLDALREAFPQVKAYIHTEDAPMLSDGNKNAYTTFFEKEGVWREAEEVLYDGQIIPVGEATLKVIHTPGHSPGSVCFLNEADGFIITGDLLFADNIGRYDLWRGDANILKDSLEKLSQLDGRLTIYPGHGDTNRLSDALNTALSYL